MKILCIDKSTPRSDCRPGQPTAIKVGNVYDVAEIIEETSQYSILNDDFKLARYSQSRFEIVDNSPVIPLRQAFNSLTTVMRSRIKELEKALKGN